jgi:hypothetical protein
MNTPVTSEQRTDTERLEWLVVGTGKKKLAAVVNGNDTVGYRVFDCMNGLSKAGDGKTWREAIDAAMEKYP